MTQIKYNVFISYSRKDYVDEQMKVMPSNVVSKVKDALTAASITYWFDEEGIYSGDNFTEKIVRSIEESQLFLFISTANANSSHWTSKEIATADELGKKIIPLRVDRSPYERSVIFRIANLSYIDYFSNPEKGIEDLIKSIKNYLAELAAEEERRKAEIEKAEAEAKAKAEADFRHKIQQEYEERLKKVQQELQKKLDAVSEKEKEKERLAKTGTPRNENDTSGNEANKENLTQNNKKEDNNESSSWFIIAFIIPILTLCIGVWYGTKYKAFWTGTEIFLVPGWFGFCSCLGLSFGDKDDKYLGFAFALLSIAIAAGIHLGIILNSVWIGVAIGVAILSISLLLMIKGTGDNPN